MWDLDHKESWVPKNWCFWTVVLEKTLESPLDCEEIKPVNPKGNQPWIFIGRTDAEAETPILWPPDVKNWLLGKDLDAGKDWRQEKKGTTEDEMVGWHHWLDGHEFEQAPGVGEGQGSLVCCSPWGCKELDTIERLNWTELNAHFEMLMGDIQENSLVAQMIKNLPAVQETHVWSLGWEDLWVGKILWRRKWQPTPVFLPGEFHGQRILAGYSPWGHKESDRTEWLSLTHLGKIGVLEFLRRVGLIVDIERVTSKWEWKPEEQMKLLE